MMVKQEFQQMQVGPGVRLLVQATPVFHRTTVACFFHNNLLPDQVATLGILPRVLRRGNTRWPTAMSLAQELAGLYGAHLGTGVQKCGDRQLSWFLINVPSDQHVAQPVLGRGFEILQAVMNSPVVEQGGLKQEYVEQEKQLQVGRIRSLINNKSSWAVFRCIQEMYGNDPFSLYELGTVEEVVGITPQALLEAHQQVINSASVDIYVIGDVDVDTVQAAVNPLLPRRSEPVVLPKSKVSPGRIEPHRTVDEEMMGQGWLVLGYRTDVSFGDPGRFAMQFLNGVLGGFVHSKLFINVREKASLAYQASSGYNANKGHLLALAGIDPAHYEQALDIMLKQVKDIQLGDITEQEMEATRSRLLTRMRLIKDDPMAQMMQYLSGSIEGVDETLDEVATRLAAVSKDDVVEVAQRVNLDTIYFLKGVSNQS